jgi:arabinose-5-phosphate isomerase
LANVEAYMRTGDDLRLAPAGATVREVFVRAGHDGRRTGAVMLTDGEGRLCGLFTDSDLARLFERRADGALDRPIAEVMTREPLTVLFGTRVAPALELMRSRKVSELPVIDADGRPAGLLDVTDLIGLLPAADRAALRPVPHRERASA